MSFVIFASAPLQTIQRIKRARTKRTWRQRWITSNFFKERYFLKNCKICYKNRGEKITLIAAHKVFSLLWKYSVITQWKIRWHFIRCLPMELLWMRIGMAYKRNIAVYRREFPSSFSTVPSLSNVSLSYSKLIFFCFRDITFIRIYGYNALALIISDDKR